MEPLEPMPKQISPWETPLVEVGVYLDLFYSILYDIVKELSFWWPLLSTCYILLRPRHNRQVPHSQDLPGYRYRVEGHHRILRSQRR